MEHKRRTIRSTAGALSNQDIDPFSSEDIEGVIDEPADQEALEKWQSLQRRATWNDHGETIVSLTAGALTPDAANQSPITIEEMDRAVEQGILESWERFVRATEENRQ